MYAARLRNHELVNILLEGGAYPDLGSELSQQTAGDYIVKETPLVLAATFGCANSTRLLLERMTPKVVDTELPKALSRAANGGRSKVVKTLLEHSANAKALLAEDKRENTPFLLAVRAGHMRCVEYMIAAGADVDRIYEYWSSKDDSACTALMHAVYAGHLDMLSILLDAGASVKYQNSRGRTALHLATKKKAFAMMELLQKAESGNA